MGNPGDAQAMSYVSGRLVNEAIVRQLLLCGVGSAYKGLVIVRLTPLGAPKKTIEIVACPQSRMFGKASRRYFLEYSR